MVEADVDKRSSRKDWEIPSTQIFRYDAHPLERNLLFIPRPFPCEPTQKFIALTGLAGLRKNSAGKNYYLNSVSDNQYKGYVWFQANDHNQLISQCRAFLCSLKISFEPENLQQKFRDFFIGKKGFLFVFDNIDHISYDELKYFFPLDSSSHTIMVTSSHKKWPYSVQVGEMKHECAALFKQICGYHEEAAMVDALGKDLGYFRWLWYKHSLTSAQTVPL